jgi:hypothetical protein
MSGSGQHDQGSTFISDLVFRCRIRVALSALLFSPFMAHGFGTDVDMYKAFSIVLEEVTV